MSLSLISEQGQLIHLKNNGYDKEHSAFQLNGQTEANKEIYVPYVHPYQENVPYDNYLVYLLARSNYSENDIYSVIEKSEGSRIGLIFPMQALFSIDHKEAESEFFLRYAQGAFSALCNGDITGFVKTPLATSRDTFSLADFYSDDSIVCVIYKPAVKAPDGFSIDQYIASLFSYGYFLQSPGKDPADVIDDGPNELYDGLTKVLRIEQSSEVLININFVKRVLQDLLPYEKDSLLSFFYQYQLIELLIERVLNIEHKKFVAEIAKAVPSATDLRNVIDQLQGQLSEKKRLGKLFSTHLSSQPVIDVLRSQCHAFLKENSPENFEPKPEFSEYLYPVRNLLFHNLRSVTPKTLSMVENISVSLKPVICAMLIGYRE